MHRFLESICIAHGQVCHLPYHQARLAHTLQAHGARETIPNLSTYLPPLPPTGVYKWRIVYGLGYLESSIAPYTPRSVRSLRPVIDDHITYTYKALDRSSLEACMMQRQGADEVLIIRQGLVTDTSIANIALCQGQHWYTPASPLLAGTTRARLIAEGGIIPRDIPLNTLKQYSAICLFNAMLPFGSMILSTEAIWPLSTMHEQPRG